MHVGEEAHGVGQVVNAEIGHSIDALAVCGKQTAIARGWAHHREAVSMAAQKGMVGQNIECGVAAVRRHEGHVTHEGQTLRSGHALEAVVTSSEHAVVERGERHPVPSAHKPVDKDIAVKARVGTMQIHKAVADAEIHVGAVRSHRRHFMTDRRTYETVKREKRIEQVRRVEACAVRLVGAVHVIEPIAYDLHKPHVARSARDVLYLHRLVLAHSLTEEACAHEVVDVIAARACEFHLAYAVEYVLMVGHTKQRILAHEQRLALAGIGEDDVMTVHRHRHAHLHLLPRFGLTDLLVAEKLYVSVRNEIVHGVDLIIEAALGWLGEAHSGKPASLDVHHQERVARKSHDVSAVQTDARHLLAEECLCLVVAKVHTEQAAVRGAQQRIGVIRADVRGHHRLERGGTPLAHSSYKHLAERLRSHLRLVLALGRHLQHAVTGGYVHSRPTHADVVSRIAFGALGSGKHITGHRHKRVGAAAAEEQAHIARAHPIAQALRRHVRHHLIYTVKGSEERVHIVGGGIHHVYDAVLRSHEVAVSVIAVSRHRRQLLAEEHLRHVKRDITCLAATRKQGDGSCHKNQTDCPQKECA